MRDAVLWYLLITFGLLGLLAVVMAVQSLGGFARRAVRRAAATDRAAVDGWTSQPV